MRTYFLTIICVSLVGAFLFPLSCHAQRTKKMDSKAASAAMDYLFKLDRNNNNRLEQDEMVGASKRYLQSLGFDTSDTVNLESVANKLSGEDDSKKSSNDNKGKSGGGYVQKTSGFGTDRSAAKQQGTRTSGFGSDGNSSPVDMESKYGERVMRLVKRTLDGYDANGNGMLEPDEIKRARWGKPTPAESDTNRDGNLTKVELAERYLAREKDSGSSRGSSRSRSSTINSKGNRVTVSTDNSRSSSRSSRNRTSTPRKSSSRSSTSPSSSRSSSKTKSTEDRYARYADGLMSSYDSNKDGKLDKGELGKMRRPPKNADADGDGSVSRTELINAVSGKTSSKPTPSRSNKVGSDPQASQSRSSSRSRSSSKSRSPRRSSSFSELDTNGDNQIKMAEFAKDWDGEIVQQFQEKDLNNDGIITLEEWNGG